MSEPTMEEALGPYNAKLCKASGEVHDQRRIVQFFYCFVRDHVPFGVVNTLLVEVLQRASVPADKDVKWDELVLDRSARLSDKPSFKLRHFLHLSRHQLPDPVWNDIEELLPLRDDIETIFTNGWAAAYAQWVVGELA